MGEAACIKKQRESMHKLSMCSCARATLANHHIAAYIRMLNSLQRAYGRTNFESARKIAHVNLVVAHKYKHVTIIVIFGFSH